MNQQAQHKAPEHMVEAIFALDLDPIKFKLMDKKEGHGWSREKADRLELEYRRFLALTAKYPNEVIAPSTEVDKFWHGHILDTMKYAADCQKVFGYFLHHFPYFGMRDAEDAANLADAAATTRRLYQQEFGGAAAESASYCARVAGEVLGAEAASAYCARVAAPTEDAAYCARVAAPAEDAAYCARVAAPAEDAAYCARVAAPAEDAAYCARVAAPAEDAAYCARVAAPAEDAAYCARVAKPAAAYCARVAGEAAGEEQAYCAAPSANYLNTVLGKGRPTLDSVPA
ncbi:MAG TPA: hypothetical protein VGE12_10015 [Noviherbaspirillum sp.]